MAATTDQQISLNRSTQRELVPAFLQKLYEMVNGLADQDLIRWFDTGDSFFVLDQERFANEVLGRWFKHKRFSSFVRQFNMYGFHKIPHLQQGILRAESDTKFWNFEHPHFLRGVFGHADNQMRKDEDTPHAVVTRQPQRLMIADGRSGQQADTNEVAEEGSRSSMESARSTNSTDLFGSLDTSSAQPSESFTSPRFASVEPSVTDGPTPVATEPHPVPQETQPPPITLPGNVTNTTSLRVPATTTPSPSQPNNDSIVQTALASVLKSPTQGYR
ncbi:hypothetical protein JVT61DRAFT_8904 [Boletus reticuloceps]|uniref:HSF-type DNA-binding domain-containing protein n=1 Tax=Boletus reticuloceps TaxID=495285 RepID=A0A8I3A6E3_9AGAM|nr:hypothetical protein JVT61DRAFT_8904 [Boletus reticuloceps]